MILFFLLVVTLYQNVLCIYPVRSFSNQSTTNIAVKKVIVLPESNVITPKSIPLLSNAESSEFDKIGTHVPLGKKSTKKFFNKALPKNHKVDSLSSIFFADATNDWKCPNITGSRSLECACDLPHTLRCNGDLHGLTLLADKLRNSPYSISLLDCSLRNVTFLSDAHIFEGISLHGLVISSGEIKRVHKSAFLGINGPLQALGLPSNSLLSVPWNSISTLSSLERLDLANNKIKAIGTSDFVGLTNMIYLELSGNQISSISQRSFYNVRKLEVLKLSKNRLGDYPSSLRSLNQCLNLRELDLSSNNMNGPFSDTTLPNLKSLESLNLNRNLIKSIQNKALQYFPKLISLMLRHNQIDVLQDHAFYGLGSLEILDLSYNGIVAISSASLQHLTRLTMLDLTHNFLRALTADLTTPLPSLKELRLGGNDISIVSENALDSARELISLSLEENPLSCDCSIRPFAEWLQVAKIHSQDLVSATCATPPRLEGAPLIQVPIESLSCDTDSVEKDNTNVIEQLEAIAKQSQSTHIRDLSNEVMLYELHYSTDYGLILTWVINLLKNDYICDAIFVYKEDNINEILIDNSPIHCESKVINGRNMVSVIVPDSSSLHIGESYRFCLVMVQQRDPNTDLNIGCSNITKLRVDTSGSKFLPYVRNSIELGNVEIDTNDITTATNGRSKDYIIKTQEFKSLMETTLNSQPSFTLNTTSQLSYNFLDSLNKSFLPGLGLGIFVTSLIVLFWGMFRLRQNIGDNDKTNNGGSSAPTAATCYTASDHIARLANPESNSRYLKLQATTSL